MNMKVFKKSESVSEENWKRFNERELIPFSEQLDQILHQIRKRLAIISDGWLGRSTKDKAMDEATVGIWRFLGKVRGGNLKKMKQKILKAMVDGQDIEIRVIFDEEEGYINFILSDDSKTEIKFDWCDVEQLFG